MGGGAGKLTRILCVEMRIPRVIWVTNRSSSIPKYWGGGTEWRGQAEPLPRGGGGGPRDGEGPRTHQAQEAAQLLEGPHAAQQGQAHGEDP